MKNFILAFILLALSVSVHAQVTTLYGNGTAGYSNSNTTADSVNIAFTTPYGLAFDTKGNLWITDQGNNFIVMINNGLYELREGYQQGGFNNWVVSHFILPGLWLRPVKHPPATRFISVMPVIMPSAKLTPLKM